MVVRAAELELADGPEAEDTGREGSWGWFALGVGVPSMTLVLALTSAQIYCKVSMCFQKCGNK